MNEELSIDNVGRHLLGKISHKLHDEILSSEELRELTMCWGIMFDKLNG